MLAWQRPAPCLIGITRPLTSLLPDSDPHDWPVVATALALRAANWTTDNDFIGTGVATWTTDSLQRWLQGLPDT